MQDESPSNIVSLPFLAAVRAASAPASAGSGAVRRLGRHAGRLPAHWQVAPTSATVSLSASRAAARKWSRARSTIAQAARGRRGGSTAGPFPATDQAEPSLRRAFTEPRGCIALLRAGRRRDPVPRRSDRDGAGDAGAPPARPRDRALHPGRRRGRASLPRAGDRGHQPRPAPGRDRRPPARRPHVPPRRIPDHAAPCASGEGDAELLAEHFRPSSAKAKGRAFRASRSSRSRAHRWPGNVRELKNAIRGRSSGRQRSRARLRGPRCVPATLGAGRHTARGDRAHDVYATLDMCEGNKRRCAEMLGVSLKTLYNRLEYQTGDIDIASATV